MKHLQLKHTWYLFEVVCKAVQRAVNDYSVREVIEMSSMKPGF